MKADGICASCGNPIVWAITVAKGNRMPIDPDPVDDGNVWIAESPSHGAPVVGVALQHSDLPADTVTYVSHFVTCPDADSWRNKKRKKR